VFVASGTQRAMRMRHTVICGLPRSTLFIALSHKWQDFRRKIIKHKMCVLISSKTFA
jgi:hypothetical protein